MRLHDAETRGRHFRAFYESGYYKGVQEVPFLIMRFHSVIGAVEILHPKGMGVSPGEVWFRLNPAGGLHDFVHSLVYGRAESTNFRLYLIPGSPVKDVWITRFESNRHAAFQNAALF